LQLIVAVLLVSGHLFDAFGEFLRAEDPSDGDRLEEAAPQDGDPAGAVEVHQLEDVGASLGGHGRAQQEKEDADESGEGAAARPQLLGEDVDDAGDQALHDTELGVDADRLERNTHIIPSLEKRRWKNS